MKQYKLLFIILFMLTGCSHYSSKHNISEITDIQLSEVKVLESYVDIGWMGNGIVYNKYDASSLSKDMHLQNDTARFLSLPYESEVKNIIVKEYKLGDQGGRRILYIR